MKPTGSCVEMWSLCQNISGFPFTNPDLPPLKYSQTLEMDAANGSFEIMKKKHKNLVIPECGLFLYKTNCFIGASPDCLMTCDACVKIKCLLSINYEKPNEKNLNYGYKSDKVIKLKIIHSYFTQCILQMAVNQQKSVLLCCMDTPWQSHWHYKFWWHHVEGY